jgi:hypothetical protein
MGDTRKPTRKRRWFRYGVRALVVLVVLFLASEGVRLIWINAAISEAEDESRVAAELALKGKTPDEYYRSRYKGTNAWPVFWSKYLEWLGSPGTKDTSVRWAHLLDTTMPVDPATPREQLQETIARTEDLAEFYRTLASHDLTAPYPIDAADGIPFEGGMIAGAFWAMVVSTGLHRCDILFVLDKSEQAEAELLDIATFWTRYRLPATRADLLLVSSAVRRVLEYTLEALERQLCSEQTALSVATLELNPWDSVRAGAEGDLVAYSRWGMSYLPPSGIECAFDWLHDGNYREYDLDSRTSSGYMMSSGLTNRWHEPIHLSGQILEGYRAGMEAVRDVGSDPPWELPADAQDDYTRHGNIGFSLVQCGRAVWNFKEAQLFAVAIKLRVLEGNAPLYLQQEAVRALIATYADIAMKWDGTNVLLIASDALAKPGDVRPNYNPTNALVVEPIEEARKRHREEDARYFSAD